MHVSSPTRLASAVGLVVLGLASCVSDAAGVGADSGPDDGQASDGGTDGTTGDASDAPVGTATLVLGKPSRWVNKGASTSIGFTVTRGTATGSLTVHVAGLPAGVTVPDVVLSDTATTGTLTFSAGATAVPGAAAVTNVNLQVGTDTLDTKPFSLKVAGASGSVDSTFGTGGVASMTVHVPAVPASPGNTSVDVIAIYPASAGANAGKIVVSGADVNPAATNTRNFFIARFNADGTPDTTFGEVAGSAHAGYVLIDRGAVDIAFGALGIAIDSAGRIFVQGFKEAASMCFTETMRVDALGVVDSAFTYDGNLRGGFCGSNPGGAVMLAGDKPAIMAEWNISDNTQEPVLVEYSANGTTTVGPTTLTNPETTRATFYAMNMIADPTGRFLLLGAKCDGGWSVAKGNCVATVARLTSTFAFDTTFGVMGPSARVGVQYADFGSAGTNVDRFMGGAIDAAGNIVAAGFDDSETHGTMVRILSADGTFDPSFGTGGKVAVDAVPGSTSQVFYNVLIDEDGRLIGVGRNTFGGTGFALTARLLPNGTADTTYGTNGAATNVLNTGGASAMTADGRVLVAGAITRGAGNDLAVWSLWP